LVNGAQIQVAHPEALVVRNGEAVYFASDGGLTLFDNNSVSQFSSEPANHVGSPAT